MPKLEKSCSNCYWALTENNGALLCLSPDAEDFCENVDEYYGCGYWHKNDMKCRVCGCTEFFACPGGCYWVEENLCSECVEKKEKEFELK